MQSFTHPDSGLVTAKRKANVTGKSVASSGPGNIDTASQKSSKKTQIQKMKDAGINLKDAGMGGSK